jgi:hypothetical protein
MPLVTHRRNSAEDGAQHPENTGEGVVIADELLPSLLLATRVSPLALSR